MASDTSNTPIIDIDEIDQDAPLITVEQPTSARHHHGSRLSAEHVQRIKRRHRRERFLINLDLTLFIIVCLGAAAVVIGLQVLQ